MRVAVLLVALTACVAEAPERWSYVHASIVVQHCTTSACHSTLSEAGNIDLSDAATAYRSLTGRTCDDTTTPLGGYVDTADPRASYLSVLLRREGPTGMPPNGRLSSTELELVEDWMRAGARCD